MLLTLGLGAAGAWMTRGLALAAAPLLGAMALTLAASLLRLPLRFPRWLQRLLVLYIGVNIGAALKPGELAGLTSWLPSVAGLLASLAVTVLLVALLLRRLGGFRADSAVYAAYPGHLVLVIQAAARADADVPQVTLVQTLRVLALVSILPLLLQGLDISVIPGSPAPTDWPAAAVMAAAGLGGLGIALLLRLPAGWLLGPMAGAAVAALAGARPGEMPAPLTDAVMTVTGAMIGTRLHGARLATLLRLLPISLAAVAAAVAIAAAFALPVSLGWDIPLTRLLLAYAPGGAEVMSLLALATGQDPAFVGLHHILRLLVMALALPLMVRWLGAPPRPPG